MNKQEYYKKNVEWLEAKSKEEGVNALERVSFIRFSNPDRHPESSRE